MQVIQAENHQDSPENILVNPTIILWYHRVFPIENIPFYKSQNKNPREIPTVQKANHHYKYPKDPKSPSKFPEIPIIFPKLSIPIK